MAWFAGDVDAAFAHAKAERKPLFLYWGAVWCPPCHYLKTKLFTQPEFIARMRGFVPVYLDGDTAQAQIVGERYQTEGYPTVIVFDADGRELTRLPSMLALDQYGEQLERALLATQPVSELVARVQKTGVADLPAADRNLLAFYSWGQANFELDDAAKEALFARLWRESPDGLERQRFLALYLAERATAKQPVVPEEEERLALTTALLDLLADPAARKTNLELIYFVPEQVVKLLAPTAGAEREVLVKAWTAAAQALGADQSLSLDDRLSALGPELALAKLAVGERGSSADSGDAKATTAPATDAPPAVPADLQARVAERVRWADESVKDEHELQAVMSTMIGLLEDAGLSGEAEALMARRLGDTLAPYYYMSWQAQRKAKAGDAPGAVALYREAWQATGGTASPGPRASSGEGGAMTRFRWGTTYLRQAIKLTPAATESIGADLETIVGELLASPDAFSGGNWSRLEGLATSLATWNEGGANQATIDALRQRVQLACDGFPADGGEAAPAARCRSFLAS